MITRICIAIFLSAGWLLSAAGTAGALTICDSTPYKLCRIHTAYVCHKVKVTAGGKSICRSQCVKDLTGGFGPCP